MRTMKAITLVALVSLLCSGCMNVFKKKTNWNISLDRKDKKPYGCYLSYESLKTFFPGTELVPLSRSFRYSSIDEKMSHPAEGRNLFIAVGLDFYLSEQEFSGLVSFARKGNEVLIFSRSLDEKLQKYLSCTIQNNGFEEMPLMGQNNGSANRRVLHLSGESDRMYGYQGRSILASFKMAQDTSVQGEDDAEDQTVHALLGEAPDTLGLMISQPDLIRYQVGEGHITLHAAPLVMSNYFLLQQDNYKYLEGILRTLPGDISKIYWNDYFKRTTRAADIGVLLRYPGTRWAFILGLFLMLMYVLFESKRKQRIIPVIEPLENTSVSFVETIGRLYFNKGDHTNLGEKMVLHFLEWVRTHYFISTNQLDETFTQQLIFKSGLPEPVVRSLMELIREVHIERKPIDESDLYHLHRTIQQFYQNHQR